MATILRHEPSIVWLGIQGCRRQKQLTVHLVMRDPESEQTLDLPKVIFARGDATAVNVENDPGLVGHWRYMWTASGGGASAAMDDGCSSRPTEPAAMGRPRRRAATHRV